MGISPRAEYYNRNLGRLTAIPQSPGIEYRSRLKYKSEVAGVSFGDSAFTSPVIRLDSEFLPHDLKSFYSYLKSRQLIFLKSPKGTGKTQWLKEYLRPGPFPRLRSVLQVGHRQSLERELAQNLNLTCYLNDKRPHWRYAVTIDSLELLDSTYDVLVIDEVEQVLRHLCGDTIKEKRGAVFSIFAKLIRNARQVICCDADLTGELTCHLIAQLRSNFEQDELVLIINDFKSSRHVEVYKDKHHLIADLIVNISEGKRVYVPVGLLKLANQLEKLLSFCRKPNGDRIKVLTLTGETSQTELAQAFFANPSTEAIKYDVLIATSTLNTGVSINCKHFDAIYGIFDSRPYTYQDCDQAVSRVRKCDTVKVWVHPGKVPQCLTLEDAKRAPIAKEITTRKYWLEDQHELSEAENLAIDVLSRVTHYEGQWSFDRRAKFIELKQGDGWTVKEVKPLGHLVKAGKEMIRLAIDPTGDAKYRRIFNAQNLDEDDFSIINRKADKTAEDKLAIAKYWISRFYNLPSGSALTLTQISDYNQNNLRNKAKALRLLGQTQEQAVFADENERRNKDMLFTDFEHRAKRRELLAGIQEASGIDPIDIMARANRFAHITSQRVEKLAGLDPNSRQARAVNAEFRAEMASIEYVVDHSLIDRVAEYVDKQLEVVNLFLDTKFEKPTSPESKTKVFNKTMGELGVCILKRQKTVNKVKQSEYVVDYQKVAEMAAMKNMANL